MLVDDRELTERAARIGALLDDIESFPDPEMQARASEIVQGLLILYGEGLARMLSLRILAPSSLSELVMMASFFGDGPVNTPFVEKSVSSP